jgi:hypothetical protein
MVTFSCSWYANIVLAEVSISAMGFDHVPHHIIFLLTGSSFFIPVNTVSADQVAWVPGRPKVITQIHSLSQKHGCHSNIHVS